MCVVFLKSYFKEVNILKKKFNQPKIGFIVIEGQKQEIHFNFQKKSQKKINVLLKLLKTKKTLS